MTKKTYVYDPKQGKMVEKRQYHVPAGGIRIMGDIEDFVSPIDGTVVKGRKGLREHCRRYGVAHAADYKNHWAESQKKRSPEYFMNDPRERNERIRDIARAFDKRGRK